MTDIGDEIKSSSSRAAGVFINAVDIPEDLILDDEPLETVLYGKGEWIPTPLCIFKPAREILKQIKIACREDRGQDALAMYCQLMENNHAVSVEVYDELLSILKKINDIPNLPQAPRSHCPPEVGKILEWLWEMAGERQDDQRLLTAGGMLYRWFELEKRYTDAKRVLAVMIKAYRLRQDRNNEAIHINNLGFEFVLEGEWNEGADLFERAAQLFDETQDKANYANARANYWLCRYEAEGLPDLDIMEAELKEIAAVLQANKMWHECKPLIYLSKVEEKRGNIEEALSLVQRAVSLAEPVNSIFLEQAREYLKLLMGKV
jgi:tetratricopeptide (TPR) repeat protein